MPEHPAHGWTTLLFVPADQPHMLAKAQQRRADAILIDLEDAVADDAKADARRHLRAQLETGALAGASAVCVRINAIGEGGEDDLDALAGTSPAAVVVPKATDPRQVSQVRSTLEPTVALIPQIESAKGVVALPELSRADGVVAIALGGEDLSVDLGVKRSSESLELLVPRALVALHARAVGVAAIDTVYTRLDDESGLIREARLARQLGFTGKLVIHPAQIEAVRDVFAPSADEIAWARRVLHQIRPNDGEKDGAGVHVVDGVMVDAPVIAQAELILARAR